MVEDSIQSQPCCPPSLFWERVSLWGPEWPQTCNPPALVSQVLRLQVCIVKNNFYANLNPNFCWVLEKINRLVLKSTETKWAPNRLHNLEEQTCTTSVQNYSNQKWGDHKRIDIHLKGEEQRAQKKSECYGHWPFNLMGDGSSCSHKWCWHNWTSTRKSVN